MGIFVGDSKNTSAARCGLKINWAFHNSLKPKLEKKYEILKSETYSLAHCVGIDTGEILVVRSGIRNNNDLVWVGRAPNIAAKLSQLRVPPYYTFITEDVYLQLNQMVTSHTDG